MKDRDSSHGIRPSEPLRFVTYLAPSIPEAFYRELARTICEPMGQDWQLEIDDRRSGPQPEDDPFTRDRADVGFMCAPCYLELCQLSRPPVELLVAPVYRDERNQGRPVYFSEVVVRRDSKFDSILGLLREGRWAYNDSGSLSGYHSVLRLRESLGLAADVLEGGIQSGSHLNSLDLVRGGGADAAAIDANVLALECEREPSAMSGLKVVKTLGPHPVQPVVIRRGLAGELKRRLRTGFLDLTDDESAASLLGRFRVRRFVPVNDGHYSSRAHLA